MSGYPSIGPFTVEYAFGDAPREDEYRLRFFQEGSIVAFADLPRGSWAEVSRSSIAPKYRWGAATPKLPAMRALTFASIALAVAFGRTMMFSLSELRTKRLIRRMGFPLRQIGPVVQYHGARAPFSIDTCEVLDAIPPAWQKTLFELIVQAVHMVSEMQRFDYLSSPTQSEERDRRRRV
jgi:hypothetical protein